MMGFFLRKYWLYLAAIATIVVLVIALKYDKAQYHKLSAEFTNYKLQAQVALSVANARAANLERKGRLITAAYEARHADEITALNARAADSQRHIRDLSVRLAAASRAGRCGVPEVPESSTEPDVPTPGDERALRIADSITAIGRGCELDAANLAALQDWVRAQEALNAGTPPWPTR